MAGMKEKTSIAKIIGIMFMSRTYAHMSHLKTGSYAEHQALGGFYECIVGQADSLAEVAQGLYGKLAIPFVNMSGDIGSPAKALEGHLRTLEGLCKDCEEPYIENIFQEIQATYRSTIYKLEELK